MKKRDFMGILAALATLFFLVSAGPGAAADCGFNLPCEETVSVAPPTPALKISNPAGAGTAIMGVGHGIGVFGQTEINHGVVGEATGSGKGVRGFSVNGIGVEGWSTGANAGVNGVNGNMQATGGPGVRGHSYNIGVYGLAPKKGVMGESNGAGVGVHGKTAATTPNAGIWGQNTGSGYGVRGTSFGGIGGIFSATDRASSKTIALKAVNSGSGWAGQFIANGDGGRGVYISTPAGNQGLEVVNGTKNAVVATSQGARALSAEESTGVYFSDYGFGKLKDGKAVIKIDPLFAETVNLNQDYFVFLQPYAKAELYVSQTGPRAFEVSLNTGDPEARFAYRLVAKRRGFEQARLQPAPWADSDPNLYPQKRTEKVAAVKAKENE
jgi:hypothetical protein